MIASSVLMLLAAALTVVVASPVDLETRDNPLAKCLNIGDGSIYIPDNSQCRSAYTAPSYESGIQKVPFGANYVSKSSSPTSGPQHCCYRCEQDVKCLGWQIDDDCTCSTWSSTIVCPPAAGTFGHSGTASTNVTGVYHQSNSNCNA